MLRRLAESAGGFYFQAVEEERKPSTRQPWISSRRTPRGTRRAPRAREAGMRRSRHSANCHRRHRQCSSSSTSSYLLAHSPELPSVLQRAIDKSRDGGAPLRLVRVDRRCRQWPASPVTKPCVAAPHSMSSSGPSTFEPPRGSGGSPIQDSVPRECRPRRHSRYRGLLPAAVPKRPAGVAKWLAAGPLNPASALFREDDYLLTEERSLPNRALYHSVITAIAEGHTSQATIAAALGRERRAVRPPRSPHSRKQAS